MKPLENLNNVEKAKLLHSLFPAEIPAFLKYVTGMSLTIAEEQDTIKAKWDNGMIAFDFWLSLTAAAKETIGKYGARLETNNRLFADQLFDGYTALYMVHCLNQYIQQQNHPNVKFAMAVALLFT